MCEPDGKRNLCLKNDRVHYACAKIASSPRGHFTIFVRKTVSSSSHTCPCRCECAVIRYIYSAHVCVCVYQTTKNDNGEYLSSRQTQHALVDPKVGHFLYSLRTGAKTPNPCCWDATPHQRDIRPCLHETLFHTNIKELQSWPVCCMRPSPWETQSKNDI